MSINDPNGVDSEQNLGQPPDAELERLRAQIEQADRAYRELQSFNDRRFAELEPLAEAGRQFLAYQSGGIEAPPGYDDSVRPQYDAYGNPMGYPLGQPGAALRQPVPRTKPDPEILELRREVAEAKSYLATIKAEKQAEKEFLAIVEKSRPVVDQWKAAHDELTPEQKQAVLDLESARIDRQQRHKMPVTADDLEDALGTYLYRLSKNDVESQELAKKKRATASMPSGSQTAKLPAVPLSKEEEMADLKRELRETVEKTSFLG